LFSEEVLLNEDPFILSFFFSSTSMYSTVMILYRRN
jgi:hypothetical protein